MALKFVKISRQQHDMRMKRCFAVSVCLAVTAIGGCNQTVDGQPVVSISRTSFAIPERNNDYVSPSECLQNKSDWGATTTILGTSRQGEIHGGIDFPQPEGTPFVAQGTGKVISFVGDRLAVDYGTIAGVGVIGAYKHLVGVAPGIVPGKVVREGEVLGYIGSIGTRMPAHLHMSAWLYEPSQGFSVFQNGSIARSSIIGGQDPAPFARRLADGTISPAARQLDEPIGFKGGENGATLLAFPFTCG